MREHAHRATHTETQTHMGYAPICTKYYLLKIFRYYTCTGDVNGYRPVPLNKLIEFKCRLGLCFSRLHEGAWKRHEPMTSEKVK